MISIDKLKDFREQTGVSITECKKALEAAGGDFDKAKEILRKHGTDLAQKRSGKNAGEGLIMSYIHPNKKIGVLLDIRCETDFVAKSKDFENLSHEISLQIAAMAPLYLKEEDIPEKYLHGEKEIYKEQLKDAGKPEEIINQIIEGKLKKYKEGIFLLSQSWVKDDQKTIQDLVNEYIAKIGENIEIKGFTRYEI
ncbi:MAG: translation elongation factor Ts [Candidatus Nealsonbacteria bacterium]